VNPQTSALTREQCACCSLVVALVRVCTGMTSNSHRVVTKDTSTSPHKRDPLTSIGSNLGNKKLCIWLFLNQLHGRGRPCRCAIHLLTCHRHLVAVSAVHTVVVFARTGYACWVGYYYVDSIMTTMHGLQVQLRRSWLVVVNCNAYM
jgi:hypothetical protein